jgi:hypothetical protein
VALYEDIAERLRTSPAACERETAALADWLASGTSSYSVHAKLRYHAGALTDTPPPAHPSLAAHG